MRAERIDLNAARAAFDAAEAAGARARVDWLKWGTLFGFWALFSFLNANQVYFEMLHRPGMHHSWWLIVFWQLAVWWVWGCLTPLILGLGRRVTGGGATWFRGLLIHLPFSLLLPAAHVAASTYIRMLIQPFDVWSDTRPFLQQYSGELRSLFLFDFFVYWAVLGVGYAFDYRERYRERESAASELKAQLAQAKLEALKMQLHPHFLFNTLHSISALLHRDPDAADRMIARLGDFLRLTLENSGAQEVSLQKELDFLTCYLEIERVRFQDRLTTSVEVEPAALDAFVPNLILQPIVENAIRHGIAQTRGPGRVEIYAKREHGSLRIRVRDNGPGLLAITRPDDGLREGLGLSNTRARLEQLYGAAHRFELENAPGGGLLVTLEIPTAKGTPS
jgi:signal transduction histidine kinase